MPRPTSGFLSPEPDYLMLPQVLTIIKLKFEKKHDGQIRDVLQKTWEDRGLDGYIPIAPSTQLPPTMAASQSKYQNRDLTLEVAR